MSARLSAAIVWSAIAVLAIAALPLLFRNMLAIPAHVPLDPNEGWNAAHALALLAGHGLYPPPQSLMVNNYPPLSFYLIAEIARHGDAIIAGRWLALLAFLASGISIALALLRMDCEPRNALLAVLFFATVLLITSDYVGMDDPQLLGHAVQLVALLLLLRERVVASAALFAVSLFIKHNLLAMPLGAGLWLLEQDRRTGLEFILWGLAFTLGGLVVFQLGFGTGLLGQLTSPRLSSLPNLEEAAKHLWWIALPAAALVGLWPDRYGLFCAHYAAAALVLGLIFAAGDGVDANAFFDLAIALSLGAGLAAERGRWPFLSAAAAVPLLIFLAVNFQDNDFFFTRAFRAQSARDIAFLKGRPGPALCDQLSLCLWAGKSAQVDVFNIGEQIKSGARDPSALARAIIQKRFSTLQLLDDAALGPAVRQAIETNYRADHTDDNGTFWEVRPAP
jgi:hypothetical protein